MLQIKSNPDVQSVFDRYPDQVRPKVWALRQLIVETATEIPEITVIEETLKWGEPSYLTKYGSTIRIDWKTKKPDQYAMYFQCTSKLVPTFKTLYEQLFEFENNRAIVFGMNDDVPVDVLRNCVAAALMYHKVKNRPLLGM